MTIHDCLVTYPEQAERVRQIMVEASESVGVSPTIKITAFNQETQEARRSDPGSWLDGQSQLIFRFDREQRRRSGGIAHLEEPRPHVVAHAG